MASGHGMSFKGGDAGWSTQRQESFTTIFMQCESTRPQLVPLQRILGLSV